MKRITDFSETELKQIIHELIEVMKVHEVDPLSAMALFNTMSDLIEQFLKQLIGTTLAEINKTDLSEVDIPDNIKQDIEKIFSVNMKEQR